MKTLLVPEGYLPNIAQIDPLKTENMNRVITTINELLMRCMSELPPPNTIKEARDQNAINWKY